MSLEITLPESLREFVEAETSRGGYRTMAEYVQDLVLDAQKRAEQQRLEQMLLEGLASGPGREANADYWRDLEARLVARHQPTDLK
jgi:antitoxin ParD1/3/4